MSVSRSVSLDCPGSVLAEPPAPPPQQPGLLAIPHPGTHRALIWADSWCPSSLLVA